MKIKHINRNETKTPTCTIQISTEYLVKESYTPEEAEKTIAQLYSLHENEGFSLEDFEKIKNKISTSTYRKIEELIVLYKEKYKNYL